MTHLVPEKRTDRNGKTVTRHVRALSPARSAATGLPAPAVPRQQDPALRAVKATAKQRETQRHSVWLGAEQSPDRRLWDSHAEMAAMARGGSYVFECSDAEAYEVFAAVGSTGDAVRLLALGARSEDAARQMLRSRRADDLGGDRSVIAAVALAHRARFSEFASHIDKLTAAGRRDEDAADAAAFVVSGLGSLSGVGSTTAQLIADGLVSFADIKAIGSSRLRSFDKLPTLTAVLQQIRAGETDWTPEGIGSLLDRAHSEGLHYRHYRVLGSILAHSSMERVTAAKSVRSLVLDYTTFAEGSSAPEGLSGDIKPLEAAEAVDRALYSDAVSGAGGRAMIWVVNDFYEAGIPAQTAAEVMAAGGGVLQARGIVEGGVARGLASGYL